MVRFISIMLVVAATVAHAQPVLPGKEFRVSDIIPEHIGASSALSDNGRLLVLWGNSGAMYEPGLMLIPRSIDLFDGGRLPFYNSETDFSHLIGLTKECSQGWGFWTEHYYTRNSEVKETIFSPSLFSTWDCSIPGEYSYGGLLSGQTKLINSRIIVCINTFTVMTMLPDLLIDGSVGALDREDGSKWSVFKRGTISTTQHQSRETKSAPWPVTLASGGTSKFGLYLKDGFGNDRPLHTAFQIYTGDLQPVGTPIDLDSLSIDEAYRYEVPLFSSDRIIILHRHRLSDRLLADIYDTSGNSIHSRKDIGIGTDTTGSFGFMQHSERFVADVLDDNSIIVLWEEEDATGDINLYLQQFTDECEPLGVVKRVNTGLEGNQRIQSLEIHGDTLYAVWASHYENNTTRIYAKFFTLNDVTSAEPLPAVSGFGISGIYPHPASGQTIFEFDLPSSASAASFAVYNILGKMVYRSNTPEAHTTVNMSAHPPGVYRAVLSYGTQVEQRPFIVAR